MTQRRALPRICIALGLPDAPRLLEQARREAEAGENFLEFRLDYLPDPARGAEAIAEFLEAWPNCTILATCRRHQNHGRFNGSIEEQLRILQLAIQHGARAVDAEIETAEVAPERCADLRSQAYLIVSWHHFETTPPLDPVLKRMRRVPADVYKLVSTSRKPTDTGRILAASRLSPKVPLVTLAMGEIGFPSRVLSTALGAVFTYAAPAHVQGTASGQVNARQLRSLYRIDKFSKAAKIFAVIADPVRHSVSPHVHNRAFQSRRIDAVYVPLLVSPNQLRDFFQFAGDLPLSGFSVTLPHNRPCGSRDGRRGRLTANGAPRATPIAHCASLSSLRSAGVPFSDQRRQLFVKYIAPYAPGQPWQQNQINQQVNRFTRNYDGQKSA